MDRLLTKLRSPVAFLLSEFVIIALGVLAAFAVDEWREGRQQQEIRTFLVESLLADLREDAGDYDEFASASMQRAAAARDLLRIADGNEGPAAAETGMSVGDAIYLLGRSPKLETANATFSEMQANGTGLAIDELAVRLKITRYYALAQDRSDINTTVHSAINRFRIALERLGYSFVDRSDIDAAPVLADIRVRALIREIEFTARSGAAVAGDLIRANRELIGVLQQARSHD